MEQKAWACARRLRDVRLEAARAPGFLLPRAVQVARSGCGTLPKQIDGRSGEVPKGKPHGMEKWADSQVGTDSVITGLG